MLESVLTLIGGAVVILIIVVGLVALFQRIWFYGFKALTNLMWWGYDIRGEHPPDWRCEVALYANALQSWNFEEIDEKREELSKLEE